MESLVQSLFPTSGDLQSWPIDASVPGLCPVHLAQAEWEVTPVALALPPNIYPHGPFLVPFHASVGLLLHVAVLPHTLRSRPIDMFLFLVLCFLVHV